jgi:hypothetical protein
LVETADAAGPERFGNGRLNFQGDVMNYVSGKPPSGIARLPTRIEDMKGIPCLRLGITPGGAHEILRR